MSKEKPSSFSPYFRVEDAEEVRAAYKQAGKLEGHKGVGELIEYATLLYVQALQDKHNGGRPFGGATPTMLRPGRRNTEEESRESRTVTVTQTVEIPRTHFLVLSEMAAQLMAYRTASSIEHFDGFMHPGDPFGTVLSMAWKIDPELCSLIVTAYVAQLREECREKEVKTPTLEEVLKSLPLCINEGRHPWMTKDIQSQLDRQLRAHVPGML